MRRLLSVFAGLVSGYALALGLAWIADPYWTIRDETIAGVNSLKPFFGPNARAAKPVIIARKRPEILFLGGSTVEGGLSPDYFRQRGMRAYNGGLPSGGLYESLTMLEHATQVATIRDAFIALDITALWGNDQAPEPKTSLGVWTPSFVHDGLATLFLQDRDYYNPSIRFPLHNYEVEGQRSIDSSLRRVRAAGGPVNVWESGMKRLQKLMPKFGEFSLDKALTNGLSRRQVLDRIFLLGSANNIRLHFFIPPCHIAFASAIESFGSKGLQSSMRHTLVEYFDEKAKQGFPVSGFFDFCNKNSFTLEPIHGLTSRTDVAKFFWDAGHFKKEVGDAMLDIMTGRVQTGDEFGYLISSRGALATFEQLQRAKVQKESCDVAELRWWKTLHLSGETVCAKQM